MRVIDLATLSLAGGSGIAEAKIPLWWADGTNANTTASTAGSNDYLTDGSTSVSAYASTGAVVLFKLSSNWPTSIKFAFEATIYSYASSYTANAELWDMTSNTVVTSSAVSTTSTTATVLRSSQFTLTPNHSYGVVIWETNSTGQSVYITDASLIIFP